MCTMLNKACFAQNTQRLLTGINNRLLCTKSRFSRVFPVINACVDTSATEYNQNLNSSHALVTKYKKLLSTVQAGGGPRGIKRHVKHNKKLLAWDRMKLLFDNYESVLEVAPMAGLNMDHGNIPRAGVLAAVGKINGIYCMVSANDATVKGGMMYPITVKKMLRIQEIAMENHLPIVFIVDSGGAFLPLQAEIFPDQHHGGRVFYNEAIMNSLDIPQLAVVCGSCTAGAAYVPTMVQENIIVHRIGTVFLGGPPLVKAALGEDISAEELGGATLHCSVSGCTDHFAVDEQEAFAIARDVVAGFNIEPLSSSEDYDDPAYAADELLGIIPCKDQHTMDMYKVIARLVDGSRFHEFKKSYGKGLLTGFAFLQGHLVGLVADNGISTTESALKGAHFIQLCDQRQIPLIFLQNTTPQEEMISSSAKLKAEAKMITAAACASVPKITIITGNCIGSYSMCGRSFSPNFLFTWPNALISMEKPDHIVNAILESKENTDVDKRKKIEEEVMYKSSSLFISSQLYSDGIILPQETRKILGQCMEIISQSRRQRTSNYSVIRM